jgi:hypothetical protein
VNIEEFSCFAYDYTDVIRCILSALGQSGGDTKLVLFPQLRVLSVMFAPTETFDVLALFVHERLSRIDVAPERRKRLQDVSIAFAGSELGVWSTLIGPPNYNDRTTSLQIRGRFTELAFQKIMEL